MILVVGVGVIKSFPSFKLKQLALRFFFLSFDSPSTHGLKVVSIKL